MANFNPVAAEIF